VNDAARGTVHTNVFAPVALDRAAERRDDDAWISRQLKADNARFMLTDADGALLATASGDALRWIARPQAEALDAAQPSFLGLQGDAPRFMLRLERAQPAEMAQALDATWIGLRAAGGRFNLFDAGMGAYATALSHWQAQTRFCTFCAAPLEQVSAGHRARCPACGKLHFPRTDAAVIVIVEHEGACLLGRQASWPAGRYSTLAGFVEPGETLEAAVAREISEEAGVEVVSCRYHSSQPWPFPASLMLGFTATARDRHIERRDGELEDARWFTPQELLDGIEHGQLALSSPVSVSWHLIMHWLRERAGEAMARRIAEAARTC